MRSIVFHTVMKRGKNQDVWLRCYVEDKVGVCIIYSIPHCHTKNLSKEAKIKKCGFVSTKLENLSSIVFHNVLLKKLSNMAKIKICDFISV